ncbi:hypothetical protein BBP40_003597 [Aspergillus hancockii]|nr:hypothetical protein BBP40_003597 [Aspergillus hancockii]
MSNNRNPVKRDIVILNAGCRKDLRYPSSSPDINAIKRTSEIREYRLDPTKSFRITARAELMAVEPEDRKTVYTCTSNSATTPEEQPKIHLFRLLHLEPFEKVMTSGYWSLLRSLTLGSGHHFLALSPAVLHWDESHAPAPQLRRMAGIE